MDWPTIFKVKRSMTPEAKEAMEISARIAVKADAIMKRLLEYQQHKEPFMSLMSDLYNKDQESKLYKVKNGSGNA